MGDQAASGIELPPRPCVAILAGRAASGSVALCLRTTIEAPSWPIRCHRNVARRYGACTRMTKVVLMTKVDPSYDDLPEERYHFPPSYLKQVEQAVGDWAVYYEPRRSSASASSRGGRQVYFAVARVTSIVEDRNATNRFYALVADYLEFDHPLSFRAGGEYFESILQREDGKTNKGAFGRSVRAIPDAEFEQILQLGFASALADGAFTVPPVVAPDRVASRLVTSSAVEGARPVMERLVARPFRDVAFRSSVRAAYDMRCAITGLKLINGGGRPEVQAAHIRPIAQGGSDSVRNGLALSGTVHWMFDRGLLSIGNDSEILVASKKLPADAMRLIREDRKLILPVRAELHPLPEAIEYHRANIFKG